MTLALEAKLYAVVNQPFTFQPIAHAHFGKQLDSSLLEHSGTNSLLDMLLRVHLKDDGIDPFQVQEVRKDEPGGSGPYDSNLRALHPLLTTQPRQRLLHHSLCQRNFVLIFCEGTSALDSHGSGLRRQLRSDALFRKHRFDLRNSPRDWGHST
jgi:hypothetical protein